MQRSFSVHLARSKHKPKQWYVQATSRQRLTHQQWSIGVFSTATILMPAIVILRLQGYQLKTQPKAASQQVQVHPAALPWIETEAECIGKHRYWKENLCFDAEHDPMF